MKLKSEFCWTAGASGTIAAVRSVVSCHSQCFYGIIIPQNGGRQNVQVRKIVDFSNFKRLYLRSETVSDEKSQGKNENFGALRAPAQTGRRKKQEEKFFDFRIVGPKPPKGCFSSQTVFKTRARRKFLGVFTEKQSKKCAG